MAIFIILLFIFLIQDFLQVLVMGISLVPDLFLLCIIMLVLVPGGRKDKQTTLIWISFIGGLIWDLRWTNLPGLTSGFNGAVVAAAICLWYKAPVQGRTTLLFAAFAFVTQILSGMVHFVFWNVSTLAAMRQFAVQQILSLPALVILCYIFWKVSERNA